MKALLRHALSAALVLASASAIAGGAMESSSSRPDLFFAWLSSTDESEPVVVNFDKRADARRLTEHCKSGLPVYSFPQNARFTCKVAPPAADSPDSWRTAEVTVKGPVPKSNALRFGVFSLKPTRTTRWNTRAITPEEHAALKALIDADKPRLRVPAKQLKLAEATAVSASDEGRTTIVVPGNVVRDDPGQYYAQRHYVFVKEEGVYAYRGMIPAKPAKYFDLDGGDLPDMLVEEDCDGWCVSLWSVSKGVRKVAAFGGH
ncbi:hypothetical protein [Variovorax sp. GB1P17]|uniref:hypothetical protein n=1 Tax=Variovorax sp. GB1P17 TaxID=3443740 RepID=UPI003F485A4B